MRLKALAILPVSIMLSLSPAFSAPTSDTITEAGQAVSPARGEALFEGREPLSGTIRGHPKPMPPPAVICGGCHKRQAAVASEVPSLDAADLLTPKSRWNAPPSSYRLETFCRVLRSGVNPVSMMLSRTMPVFDVTPQQCESLWLYLTNRTSP